MTYPEDPKQQPTDDRRPDDSDETVVAPVEPSPWPSAPTRPWETPMATSDEAAEEAAEEAAQDGPDPDSDEAPPAEAPAETEPEPDAREQADVPAWADAEAFVEAFEEPEYDDWEAEQDLSGAEPAVTAEPDPEVNDDEREPVADVGAEPSDVEAEPSDLEAEPEPEAYLEPEPTAFEPEQLPPDEQGVPALDDEAPLVSAARPSRRALAGLGVLVVLLAALAGALGVASVRTQGLGEVEESRKAALDAARNAARLVFSYDYRHLDKDFAAGRATTTGEFQTQYDRTTKRLVDDVAPRYKAVVVAAVSDAAVVSASNDRAVALVFVDQQSTSTLNAASKLTQSRLEMTMVRRGDRWLVASIKAF